MSYIDATNEYGLVVRKEALRERGLSLQVLSESMQDVDVLGEDAKIISYGPIFGPEAQGALKVTLGAIGLVEIDDFFGFDFLMPDWIRLGVATTE